MSLPTKYYAYCVTNADAPELNRLGIDSLSVENLHFTDVIVTVSKFAGDVVRVTRANVLAHEAVVREVMSHTTPLPFRFGTLVSYSTLNSFVDSRRNTLLSRLEAIHDCVEMSIKVIWPNPLDGSSDDAKTDRGVGAGTAFLQAKRRELLGNERLSEEAQAIRSWLTSGLTGNVRQELVKVEPKQKIVISGAFLIEKSSESEFRNSVKELQNKRPELHFLTSGPWPPYTFANIDLEFETHFGVS